MYIYFLKTGSKIKDIYVKLLPIFAANSYVSRKKLVNHKNVSFPFTPDPGMIVSQK